jgi:hypothetical protein
VCSEILLALCVWISTRAYIYTLSLTHTHCLSLTHTHSHSLFHTHSLFLAHPQLDASSVANLDASLRKTLCDRDPSVMGASLPFFAELMQVCV